MPDAGGADGVGHGVQGEDRRERLLWGIPETPEAARRRGIALLQGLDEAAVHAEQDRLGNRTEEGEHQGDAKID